MKSNMIEPCSQWRIQSSTHSAKGPHHVADPYIRLEGQFNMLRIQYPTFISSLVRGPPAASIRFEILGVVNPGKKNSIFPGKFPKNFDFFRQLHKKSIFQENNFSGNLKFVFDFPG